MKRALLLMTLLVCLVLRAEATATTSIEGDTTLTITVTEAGDVATFAAGISTSDYPNVTRVNIVGEGVTPSADDLAAIEKFTAISILDLSKVKIEDATAYKNIKTYNYNSRKISLVVAAAKDENDGTVVDDQVEYLRNILKTVAPESWNSIFNAIYVYNTNTNGNHTCHAFMTTYDNSSLKDIDVLANGQDNLNIISIDETWDIKNNMGIGNNKDILVALNNVNVKRLVLANVYGGWEGGTLETFTNPHVKALTLPTGATNLTQEEDHLKNIKLGEGAAAKAFTQLVWAHGEDKSTSYLYGYSAEAGAFAALSNDHYYQSDINDAYKEVFFGNINLDDFDFFKAIKNNRLDLSNLTHVDADGNEIDINPALDNYKNEYIEYLVLPENDDYPTDPTFNNWFEGENACKNLKAVGIKISEHLTTDSIRNSIVISSNERGGIYSIAELMGNNRLRSAHKYQLSGLAYAKDLGSRDIHVDENGHLTVSEKDKEGDITRGTTGTEVTGILDFTNATDFDYSHLRLWNKGENISEEEKKAAQNDLCLSLMGYGNTLTSIKLPTDESVYRLPSSFCPQGVTKLQSICIPANYTEIGSCAFKNIANLVLVYTTAKNNAGKSGYLVGGKFQEQEPDITDENTEHTVQLPTNLKRIEKNAFANVEKFTDVYVTTNTAGEVPYCEKDAFSSGTLQGWGGFDGKHPITRKNYQNAPDKLFGILHFPSGLPKAKAELFTDLQRDYSLVDEAGTTDGNGNVFIWATQAEWYRSFYQANTGYTWNDWTVLDENGGLYGGLGEKYNKREDLADKDGNLNDYAKKYGLTVISGENAIYNSFAPKNPNYTEGSTESILEQNDTWIGWHQFVLVGAYDYFNPDEKKWHFSTSDNNWWTICLPFNMTAQQIEDTWGKGTKLCTLTGVTRNYTKNLICLEFGKDLVQEAKGNAYTGNVLKWRMPYMIKPAKTYTSEDGEATGPSFTLSDEQYETLKEATKKITDEEGNHPRPQTDNDPCCISVQAKDENGNLLKTTAGKPYMYTFLGSYTKQYIPTYAYFLAWCEDPTNTNGWVNYFYQTEKPTIKNWNAYTSIVGHFNVEEATWTIPDKEAGKWAFSCSSDTEQRDAHEDALPNPSGDTKVKLAFDEGNATAIGHMTANGSIQSVENATVYNLNGQVVAHNGNVEGLPKGVYIIAGKKFIVK